MMRVFFDTNVLVYLYDADAPDKKERARELFEREALAGRLILSTQVLQEFYVTVTRKLAVPVEPKSAEDIVRNLSVFPVVSIDTDRILSAIGISRRYQSSFWDSLIIEAALTGGAERLLSEDLQDGQIIQGLIIENPFRSFR